LGPRDRRKVDKMRRRNLRVDRLQEDANEFSYHDST
jgi:hypothetical protein